MKFIAPYELKETLGIGGMGTVYRAIDTRTQQVVAIKQLHPTIAQPQLIERFQREGEALRDLNHPNIVKLLDTFTHEDNHYLVMEYVSGGDLTDLLEQGLLSIGQIVNLAIDLADALTRAHRLQIVHRDLKPANVLIGEDGVLRLTDFGVAHLGYKERMTATDMMVGTFDYLAPEALQGSEVDHRVDIWAFGVILFEMLSGKRPFSAPDIPTIINAILTESPPDLETLRPDAPPALIDLVYRMLSKDPQARIPSIRLVGAELEALLFATNLDLHTPVQPPSNYERGRFVDSTPAQIRVPHNLPAQTTSFVGRDTELAELSRLLKDDNLRLITVLASGGMGKTRLTLQVAEQNMALFADGVYFVELAPISTPDQIVTAVAHALNFHFAESPVPPPIQLVQFLQERQLLLVMDNFEHLIAGAGVIAEILKGAPQVQVLASSRTRLKLSGETIFHLGSMDFPDWETPEDAQQYSAVKLFMQSARRVRPDFELTMDNLHFVARICRLVQGLPLGILLAAAWLDTLSTEEIATEIAESADVLETEMQDVPERQRSIRAIYDQSLQILSAKEQHIFTYLSVFKGGFSREAAQKVTGATIRNLTTLVNHALIQRNTSNGRYHIHELLRQYAEETLHETGEYTQARTAHARYFHSFAPDLNAQVSRHHADKLLTLSKHDWDNMIVALLWMIENLSADETYPLLLTIHGLAILNRRTVEYVPIIFHIYNKVGQPIEQATHPLYCRLYILIQTYKAVDTSTMEEAMTYVENAKKAMELAEVANDLPNFIFASILVGIMEFIAFHTHERLENVLNEYYQEDVKRGLSIPPKSDILHWLALGHARDGHFDTSMDYIQRTVNLTEEILLIHVIEVHLLAIVLLRAQGYITGDFTPLPSHVKAVHQLSVETEEFVRLYQLKTQEAYVALDTGDVDRASNLTEEVISYSNANNMETLRRQGYILRGDIALHQHDLATARHWYEQAATLYLDYLDFSELEWGLTIVQLSAGAYTDAKEALVNYFTAQSVSFPCLTNPVLYIEKFGESAYFGRALLPILAMLQMGLGEPEQAAELLGKLSHRPFPYQHWAEELPLFTQLPSKLETMLGRDRYKAAFERGKTMDLITAVPTILGLSE